MKKKLLIASALALPSIGLAGTALAVSNDGAGLNDQMAEKLATRFNLNKDEVSAFMLEQREEKRAETEAKVTEALKAAGFTDAQIAELQAKKGEQREAMKTWRDANPEATREEMKAHHEAEKAEFEAWATEQGIDLSKARETLKDSGIGRGMHRGPRGTNQ